jgi:hypothetical protein
MYQFRQVAEDRLLLGRPRSIEISGIVVITIGLAVLGAPLAQDFDNWVSLLAVGFALVLIGLRLSFLYSRITLTRMAQYVLVEGYWFRSAFRVKRANLLAIRNRRHDLGSSSYSSLEMVLRNGDVLSIYSSWLNRPTSDDAILIAKFLGVAHEYDSDWNRLCGAVGDTWRSLWGRKGRRVTAHRPAPPSDSKQGKSSSK